MRPIYSYVREYLVHYRSLVTHPCITTEDSTTFHAEATRIRNEILNVVSSRYATRSERFLQWLHIYLHYREDLHTNRVHLRTLLHCSIVELYEIYEETFPQDD